MAEGAAAARQGEQVAGVGVGVEVAELQQLLQTGDHPGADQGCRVEPLGFQFLTLLQLRAVDPGGCEHPPGGEAAVHPRHDHRRVAGEEPGEPFGVGRLLAVVDLLEQ